MGKNAKLKKSRKEEVAIPPGDIKLDLGCGKSPSVGFDGVDILDFGQKHKLDLRKTPWPWKDASVSEAYSSHFVEHLTGAERIPFFNELYRVMKVGATARIITPEWSHARAYGDPTHQWPPMSGWYPLYLNKGWRDINGPHVPYTCDFDFVVAVGWDQWLNVRADKEFPLAHYTNTVSDLIVTLTKKP